MLSSIISFVKICGYLKLIELIYRLFWMLRRTIRTTDHLTERYGKGSWVLITGGSDGIALEMAKELARKQFNLVLVARNADKLKAAAE